MATDFKEVSIIPASSGASDPTHGPFVGNMMRRQNAWETRPGWGQIGQWDSGLGLPADGHGYQEVLGSGIFKTDFGHTQILTILRNLSFTGNVDTRGYWQQVYSVVIYDVTSRQVHEEVLTRHTSEQDPAVTQPTGYRGVYETNNTQDFSSFPVATSGKVWTVEYQDSMYFGSASLGVWQYIPGDFGGITPVQLDGTATPAWAPTYGESSLVIPVPASPGLTVAAAAYLDSGGFPTPVSAAVIDNRLCYASGRSVYFSDPGYAGSIRGANILQIPCEDALSCIIEFSGNLMCFTPRETWLYQPNVGDIISNGRLTKVSGAVGCSSTTGACRAGGTLVWIDARGAYTLKGLFDIDTISLPIKNLFDPGIGVANPLTSYYIGNGKTTTTDEQPESFMYATSDEAVLTYDSLFRQLVIAFPSQNAAWVYSEGAWYNWNWSTVVNSTNVVKATVAIKNLWPLSIDGKLFGVAGTETYTPNDQTFTGGTTPTPENYASNSFYVVEAGVGGSLDRTVAAQQDNRTIAGYYQLDTNTGAVADGYAKLGKPYPAPVGYTFPVNTSGVPAGTYVYPVYASVPASHFAFDNIMLEFKFDNTNWTPQFTNNTNSTQLDIIVPSERTGSAGGWGITGAIPGVAEAQCYDSGTGLPSRTGNTIRLQWDATTAIGINGFSYLKMDLAPYRDNLLLYIGFRKKTGTLSNTCMSIGPFGVHAKAYSNFGAGTFINLATYFYHQAYIPNLHTADDCAAPIDWVIKTDQIGLDGQDSIKTRGLYVHLVDHGVGTGTGALAPNWPLSTFNTLGSGDMNDYSAQVKDFQDPWTSTEHSQTKANIRNRITTTTGELAPKVFGNNAAIWGASGSSTAGSVLVDNTAYDTRAISDNIRGETVTWALFGHLRSIAEKLIIDSAKAVITVAGARRRRGR